MISRIKSVIITQKNLISNFGYLSTLQIFNILIPLMVYPYLLSVLGTKLWGKIVFAQTIIFYFSLVIRFGFDMYATREVSINRNDKEQLSQIVSSVFYVKILLLLFSFLVLFLLLYVIPDFWLDRYLFIFSFLLCVSDVLFPVWYFQGIEKMRYITFINLFSKLVFAVLIFVLVREKSDYLYVPLLNGIGAFGGGVIALYIVVKRHFVKFVFVEISYILNICKDSFYFFITNVCVASRNKLNTIILGAFIGLNEVAYYDLAMKLISVAKMPFMIISRVLYPYLSKNFNREKFYKIVALFFVFGVFAYIVLFLFANFAVTFLGGEKMLPTVPIVHILGIELILAAVSSSMGIVLASQGYGRKFMYADVLAFIVYVFAILVLALLSNVTIYTISVVLLIATFITIVYKYKTLLKENII